MTITDEFDKEGKHRGEHNARGQTKLPEEKGADYVPPSPVWISGGVHTRCRSAQQAAFSSKYPMPTSTNRDRLRADQNTLHQVIAKRIKTWTYGKSARGTTCLGKHVVPEVHITVFSGAAGFQAQQIDPKPQAPEAHTPFVTKEGESVPILANAPSSSQQGRSTTRINNLQYTTKGSGRWCGPYKNWETKEAGLLIEGNGMSQTVIPNPVTGGEAILLCRGDDLGGEYGFLLTQRPPRLPPALPPPLPLSLPLPSGTVPDFGLPLCLTGLPPELPVIGAEPSSPTGEGDCVRMSA